MPLVSVKTLDDISETRIAIWKITESVKDFVNLYSFPNDFIEQICDKYKSTSRQCEVLAVRLLINHVFKHDVSLSHDDNGKPILSNGYKVSVSHTKGYAVIITSKDYDVAVDIEHISNRVIRVKKIFLRTDEVTSDIVSVLIHWCTKETLYKLYSSDKLGFKEIRVNQVNGNSERGYVLVENLRRSQKNMLNYFVTNDYVLTYFYSMSND